MFELTSLGFEAREIHKVVPDEHCTPFVRTTWCGEDGYFGISTSTRLDLSLNGVGLRNGALPIVRTADRFSVHEIAEIELLGIRRPAGEVTAFPGSAEGNVFGHVGAPFFSNAALAVDPAGPYVAVALRPQTHAIHAPRFFGVPVIGDSGLPVTDQVRLPAYPRHGFATLFATTEPRSYMSSSLLDTLPRRAVRSDQRTDITIASGLTIDVSIDVKPEATRYVVDVGAEAIGLVLGMDVLRRFITVFDFISGMIWLQPYRGAI